MGFSDPLPTFEINYNARRRKVSVCNKEIIGVNLQIE